MIERLCRLAAAVPDDVELGFHLCYGDVKQQHFMQPRDLGALVEIANSLAGGVARTIEWIHVPVPRDRDDPAYFAPLGRLRPKPGTELYLGLLHDVDGVEGAARRIAAARAFRQDFGVATECGFGRRPPESIGPLLELHARVAAPVTAAGDRSTEGGRPS